jgi:ABC-type transport system involved in cytochrome c biogenesis ATPase subunit
MTPQTVSKDKKIKTAPKAYAGNMKTSIKRALTYMKNLKVFPEIHKQLRMEAAARDVHLYDLTAAALRVGLSRPKDLERELKQLVAAHTSPEQQPEKE